jgi:hypothetical protein
MEEPVCLLPFGLVVHFSSMSLPPLMLEVQRT